MVGKIYVNKKNEFQFQCGAIKSNTCFDVSTCEKEFQFQCGAIKSETIAFNTTDFDKFQFQCGAIKSLSIINQRFYILVSIPVWCD